MLAKDFLLVCGVGGHSQQVNILAGLLSEQGYSVAVVTEKDNPMVFNCETYFVSNSSTAFKDNRNFFLKLSIFLINFIEFSCILKSQKPSIGVIGLGPFINLPAFLTSKIFSVPFLMLESRCRFVNLSKAARLLIKLGCCVFVQNRELAKRHGLRCVGRLE